MMDASLIDDVRAGWGWIGLEPKRVAAVNAFGNLLVEDHQNRFWRICPEELLAEVVAETEQLFERLLGLAEFLEDWEMTRPIQIAHNSLGAPIAGSCFCLKLPAALGGEYNAENFGTISINELIVSSGDIARQIKDLPDGAEVQLKIVD